MLIFISAPESTDALPVLSPIKSITVDEGAPATFTTQVTAKQKPTIRWYREGLLIPESEDFKVLFEILICHFIFFGKSFFIN